MTKRPTSNNYTVWTPEMVSRLQNLYGTLPVAHIAREMHLTPARIWSQLARMGIKIIPKRKLWEPSPAIWIETASRHATAARIAPREVLAGYKSWPHVHARWRAWREILETYPRLSQAGVARISGFDHTTLRSGLLRLAQMEAAALRSAVVTKDKRFSFLTQSPRLSPF